MTDIKKKILFLSPYPNGIGPSQRFRFEQYLDFLSKHYKLSQKTFWNRKSWDILYSDASFIIKFYYLSLAFIKRQLLLFTLFKYDIVFIHREVTHIGPPIFEWLIRFILRKKIIYDFDDAIWHLNYSEKNKIARFFKAPWKVKYICKWADIVIVGNSYLADYAKQYNNNVRIIPTTINTKTHQKCNKTEKQQKITIGWTGTLTTLKQLETILPVIKKIKQRYDIDFYIISNIKPNFDIEFEFVEWQATSEVEDLCKIDIGIMPLPDDEWAKGKCGLKGLQYMALEIPTIMSPVGVNTEIINNGENGFLAKTGQEWFEKLSLLIENEEIRKKLGKAGRKTVVKKYSVETNIQKYLKVINPLIS